MIRHVLEYESLFVDKTPYRTSILTGKEYILEVLEGNPTRCFESFRMKPHVFRNLCDRLKMMKVLQDQKDVSVEEGLAMGLAILGHGHKQRIVAERFQHSTTTVHKWFKWTIRALAALGTNLIRPVNRGQNCIGALDGTHAAAWSPASKHTTFRVMAACSQDMMFTFVYTRSEGTAHDARVFLDALTRQENNFPLPPEGSYYVVDAGYPNIPGFLAPYRGERYHFHDDQMQQQITRKRELFNHRHLTLCNVIERAFGAFKATFPILKSIPNYPLRRQKMEDRADTLFTMYEREGLVIEDELGFDVVQEGIEVDMSQQNQMAAVRDVIANEIWDDYNCR
ncbi:hypothetical protein AQUCO_05900030v1 [Aquilegia coerulea]|uniref:Uncharacterized protein n=1 Tax=Aquilegia coerulea TaxID=218851 RepID=A0A2G5CE32_AQUCA|nr:hypothetical protein AQUCO_05900030v1 [Aquilegia coerulea]